MYSLPLSSTDAASSSSRLPLHEHTALIWVTGLLHDDFDDRMDAIRGALEIDPFFGAWAVCVSYARSEAKLGSLDGACRWLSNSTLSEIIDPSLLLKRSNFVASSRSAWRAISVASISAARYAQQRSTERHAFWLTSLCKTKQQLDDYAKLNGHSPLHGFSLEWPPWLEELEAEVHSSNGEECLAATIRRASQSKDAQGLVGDEETELWFRQYPEFMHLAPQLIKKLQRLSTLEEKFDETLQKEKLASMQQLAYGASHEINNPLANISTRAQTLVYHEADPDRRHKLLAINEHAFRAYEMIADLMLFAKPPQLEMAQVPLESLLNKVRDEISDKASEQETNVLVRVEDRMPKCPGDPTQLAVAIKAICMNGIEAIAGGGQLVMEAQLDAEKRGIEISIEDSGPGISESARRHLFDPFFSGREAGRGLGFGLSKAWRIVEQHHGRITVDSRPDCGSRFTISLPLHSTKPTPHDESTAPHLPAR